MNNKNRLQHYKTQAAILLKHFQSTDDTLHMPAAKRMLALPFLAHSTAGKILADRSFFRLKHVYAVIALEKGHNSWSGLREQVIMEDCMYHDACGVYLNVWFANYAEAKTYQQQNGGYLLSYRHHFYVASADVIAALNLDGFANEWAAIDFDWVQPADKAAKAIIYKQAKANYLARKTSYKKPVKSNRPDWLKSA